jgi:hypothetical protein
MCFVLIWEQTATCATYSINCQTCKTRHGLHSYQIRRKLHAVSPLLTLVRPLCFRIPESLATKVAPQNRTHCLVTMDFSMPRWFYPRPEPVSVSIIPVTVLGVCYRAQLSENGYTDGGTSTWASRRSPPSDLWFGLSATLHPSLFILLFISFSKPFPFRIFLTFPIDFNLHLPLHLNVSLASHTPFKFTISVCFWIKRFLCSPKKIRSFYNCSHNQQILFR